MHNIGQVVNVLNIIPRNLIRKDLWARSEEDETNAKNFNSITENGRNGRGPGRTEDQHLG